MMINIRMQELHWQQMCYVIETLSNSMFHYVNITLQNAIYLHIFN